MARLCVDVALPHLDRPFDYLVPERIAEQVVPGARVRVRFAGQLVDAVVLERTDRSEHPGRLSWVERAVSGEAVLTPEIAGLARAVADRWGGSMADVLRLALPRRHATAEAEAATAPAVPPPAPDAAGWRRYRSGAEFLRALHAGRAVRAVWQAVPGEAWPLRLAEVAATAAAAGRGAVVVVPDRRDLERAERAFAATLGADGFVALSAELGPAERYRRWLRLLRGQVRVVVGTRAAAFAPVTQLGVVAIWDDGDDVHAEPRAPYPHTRDLLVLRAHRGGAAMLLGGFARTSEAQQLLVRGWARPLVADRTVVRAAAPRVSPVGDDRELARDEAAARARIPSLAFEAAREALNRGEPVLVQVPRRGYLPALACAACRAPARCRACQGPLGASSGHAVASCRWCGRPAGDWECPGCGANRMRAVVVGAARTAEEIGRAFPGRVVRGSGREQVLARVPRAPEIVVATPGAEPVAEGGYGAALLLDGWALLSRSDLRAGEETLRRWMAAAALVRPAERGGRVVVGADGSLPVVQALLRWDPVGFAERELADRVELGFPPASRMAAVTGPAPAVAELVEQLRMPDATQLLGPVALGEGEERLLLRVPTHDGAALALALREAAAVRSARKAPGAVRVQLDPLELL